MLSRTLGNQHRWLVWSVCGLCWLVALFPGCQCTPAPPRPDVGGDNDPPQFSAAECEELRRLHTEGVSRLENGLPLNAEPLLAEVAQRDPQSAVAAGNLAIARVQIAQLQDETQDPNKALAALPSADQALQRWRELAGPTVGWYLLREKYLERLQGIDSANFVEHGAARVRLLQEGTERHPESVFLWWRLYDLARNTFDEEQKQVRLPALQRVIELAPGNLRAQLDLLKDQSEAHDPGVIKTLAALRTLYPAVARTSKRIPADWDEQFQAASQAAQAGEWKKLFELNGLINYSSSVDWTVQDLKRIDLTSFSFIDVDYQPTGCQAEARPQAPGTMAAPRFDEAQAIAEAPGVLAMTAVDFDLDRRWDLSLLLPDRLKLLGRDGDDGWNVLTSVELTAPLRGVAWADLDRDAPTKTKAATEEPKQLSPEERQVEGLKECFEADADAIVYGEAGIVVLRNELDPATKQRTLTIIDQTPELSELRNVTAVCLVDLDHEGDLDLVAAAADGFHVFANRGDATFFDITSQSDLPAAAGVQALAAVDVDQDLDMDLLAVGTQPTVLLENLRHGSFRSGPVPAALSGTVPWQQISVEDLDANGQWDILLGGETGVAVALNTWRAGVPKDKGEATRAIDASAVGGLFPYDLDNDTWLDVVAWSPAGLTILAGQPDGALLPAESAPSGLPDALQACVVTDLDGDGAGDLIFAASDQVLWRRQVKTNDRHWIDIRVRGEEKKDDATARVNHFGIGSTIEIKSGPLYRRRLVQGQTTHFGLGDESTVDVVRIIWSNGVPQVVLHPFLDQALCEKHKVTGSCPYIYTWNGWRFVFLTDALWAAPLGMTDARGELVRPRAWEYLNLPGERLQPRDGKYVLQLTEELWEAAYFDQVELLAVDHPDDVEIFSNEKVGPPDLAEFQIHTVRNRRAPVAARNQRGEDVLPIVTAADENYLRGQAERHLMGLMDEHYLELDLGPIEQSQPRIMLYLTGWMHPGDTSLNEAIRQNSRLTPPAGPALWTPDAAGEWRMVRPFVGFPGGKTKTIAIDVSDAFAAGDYRLRLVTNMEIYWDEAFFTVDDGTAETRVTRLSPSAADLHYRGFSAVHSSPNNGPERFDYAHVATGPKWPPLGGRFTRYGDVTALLQAADDRLVVLAAGDEMTVSFDALPPPPSGWKRDFLLYNNGWDKDAVLATIFGQQVEPLPFQAMGTYPFPREASPPTDQGYRQYVRTYQTRTSNAPQFWGLLRSPTTVVTALPINVFDLPRPACGRDVQPSGKK